MDRGRTALRVGDRAPACTSAHVLGASGGSGFRCDFGGGDGWTGAGFAFDSYASGGKWVAAANELVFALVGIAFVVRGSPEVKAIAGGALGFLGLGVGLSKIPVFLHGVVLSVVPT